MAISRRSVLVQGGVIGAGLLASDIPGFRALAWAEGPPKRVSLQGLAWDSPVVATYREGVRLMKALSSPDPFAWETVEKTHMDFCPHGNWYFLPWHRAFVVSIEKIIRELTSKPEFAMPYWDWTADPMFPGVFATPETPDSQPNALYLSTRTWKYTDPFPDNVVGPGVLDGILQARPYEVFGTARPPGQNSTGQEWVRKKGGLQGELERTPHNTVHNKIGGAMPKMYSPRDPIFFMHHGNIDRIWAAWNAGGGVNSDEAMWKDMEFKDNFYNANKTRWSPKVSDLFDPVALGYTYGLGAVPLAQTSPQLLSLSTKLATVFAGPIIGRTAGVRSFTKRLKAKPSRRLEISVPLDTRSLSAVAHRPTGSAYESGTRAYALIRDVVATQPENAEYLVFIKAKGITDKTPTSDPHYVGLFSIFTEEEAKARPSFVLDLTDAIVRVYGSISKMPKDLALDIFAVPDRSGVNPGTITAGSVEIVFVTP
ncbi:MAG: tyrosinase family protein [Rhizomicrobium sp.]|jgi:tyrosinase